MHDREAKARSWPKPERSARAGCAPWHLSVAGLAVTGVVGCTALRLDGFREVREAGVGAICTITEEENSIEFFGIDRKELADVEKLLRHHYEDDGYINE